MLNKTIPYERLSKILHDLFSVYRAFVYSDIHNLIPVTEYESQNRIFVYRV